MVLTWTYAYCYTYDIVFSSDEFCVHIQWFLLVTLREVASFGDQASKLRSHSRFRREYFLLFFNKLFSVGESRNPIWCLTFPLISACNCNLHASKCRFNMELYQLSGYKSGGVCRNCRHNTAGRNCNYCQEGFYRDKSKEITHRKACKGMTSMRMSRNMYAFCILVFLLVSLSIFQFHFGGFLFRFFFCLAACNCNLHARRCRFNRELYQLSGFRSGGVCLGCKHNTAGRHCHYCKEGFYRDSNKYITDRRACKGICALLVPLITISPLFKKSQKRKEKSVYNCFQLIDQSNPSSVLLLVPVRHRCCRCCRRCACTSSSH